MGEQNKLQHAAEVHSSAVSVNINHMCTLHWSSFLIDTQVEKQFYKVAGVIVGLISVWLDLISWTDRQGLRNVWKPIWTSAVGVWK